MKSKNIIAFVGALGLVCTLVYSGATLPTILSTFANESTYTLTLNAENNLKSVTETSNGSYVVNTQLNNNITLNYTNAKTVADKHIALFDGTLLNQTTLSGIKTFEVNFTGTLTLRLAVDKDVWVYENTLTANTNMIDGSQEYNYFELSGTAEITSINMAYSCTTATFSNYLSKNTVYEAEHQTITSATIKDLDSAQEPSGYVSNRQFVDAGDRGSVHYTFYAKEELTTILAVAYHTANADASVKINVNGVEQTKNIPIVNNWAGNCGWSGTQYHASAHLLFDVTLENGINNISVTSNNEGQGKYLNFDYVKFIDQSVADGSRIQMERPLNLVQGSSNYHRICREFANVDGAMITIDSDGNSKPAYFINVPETGRYTVQFAYCTDNSAKQYGVGFIQDTTQHFTPTFEPGRGWSSEGATYYTSKYSFEVDLTEGDLILYINYVGGYIDFDWVRLFKTTDYTVGSLIEAEDVILGHANVMKHQSTFPVVSNYLVEFEQSDLGYFLFDVNVPSEGTYTLQLCGYTGDSNSTANFILNGVEQDALSAANYATGWINPSSTQNIMEFDVTLNEGNNTFKIYKGDQWIDFDWFKIV